MAAPSRSVRWLESGDRMSRERFHTLYEQTPEDFRAELIEGEVFVRGRIPCAPMISSRDLHSKKNAYRRNGVQEYIVWRVNDRAIDWFVLEAGEYVSLAPGPDGIIESRVFPGLRMDVAAMLELDAARVLAALA